MITPEKLAEIKAKAEKAITNGSHVVYSKKCTCIVVANDVIALLDAMDEAEKEKARLTDIYATARKTMKLLSRDLIKFEAENTRLREFARHVIKEKCWGIEIDGFEIQDLAEKLELIKPHIATRDDIDGECDYEVGDTIYKFTAALTRDKPDSQP